MLLTSYLAIARRTVLAVQVITAIAQLMFQAENSTHPTAGMHVHKRTTMLAIARVCVCVNFMLFQIAKVSFPLKTVQLAIA